MKKKLAQEKVLPPSLSGLSPLGIRGSGASARDIRSLAKRIAVVVVHVWIVFHFASVFIASASVPPATRLAGQAWSCVGGYLQFLYLNHGYHFFSPDPGTSTLIAYEATLPDGEVQWNRIPNHNIWPRLNYHRHFMLTEHMAASVGARPEIEELLVQTYADEIARQTGARKVLIYEVEHELSWPVQVRAGRHLDDPVTYFNYPLGEYEYPSEEESQTKQFASLD